jgi:hypothetical protein
LIVRLRTPPRKSPMPQDVLAPSASSAASTAQVVSTGLVAATASSWFAW